MGHLIHLEEKFSAKKHFTSQEIVGFFDVFSEKSSFELSRLDAPHMCLSISNAYTLVFLSLVCLKFSQKEKSIFYKYAAIKAGISKDFYSNVVLDYLNNKCLEYKRKIKEINSSFVNSGSANVDSDFVDASIERFEKYNIGVISGYYPGRRFNSNINHFLYCERNSFTYIDHSYPGLYSSKYMRKIESILKNLDRFEWVFWIDDDAYFTNFDISLTEFIPDNEHTELVICRSPQHKSIFTKFSSGSFLIKNTEKTKRFLFKVLVSDLKEIKEWWTEDLGYFTKGDQDAFVYLTEMDDMFKGDFCKVLDNSNFNSRPEEYVENLSENLLVHFTGKDKHKELEDFYKRMKSNIYLVDDEYLNILKENRD